MDDKNPVFTASRCSGDFVLSLIRRRSYLVSMSIDATKSPRDGSRSGDIPAVVEALLDRALREAASDIHLEPTAHGFDVKFRIDGLLRSIERFEDPQGRSAVGRLMVLAHLLTYRLDIPQEGRLTFDSTEHGRAFHLRISVMPTTHGMRCVVRLPADLLQPKRCSELSLPAEALRGLETFAATDAGMLLLTGPAGSGKTTTIYALLQHIVETSPGVSIIALEDPVERDLPGITQIEVSPFGQLTYEKALRSILRQDPQVLMVGEIRDAATASIAVQAALSGHRLISTLHAGSPGGAVARLVEMGIEPYQITSALFGVLGQRLVRRKAPGITHYKGRVPIAEFVPLDVPLRHAILARSDAEALRKVYTQRPGYKSLRQCANALVEGGDTDAEEITRILGA